MNISISTPKEEGVYQGSKWLKIQMLIDANELKSLFHALGDFWILPLTGIVDGSPIAQDFFLQEYHRWIENLQKGVVPLDADLRKLLACAFTDDLGALWLQEVGLGRYLTKIRKPVVQVQTHYFSYSDVDKVFRSMSMGPESIFWGLQFSFPQIYQNPKTMELLEVEESSLFRKIQLWTREHTRATPFLVEGKRVNATMRLGKCCFSWIQHHPQLQNIGVYELI